MANITNTQTPFNPKPESGVGFGDNPHQKLIGCPTSSTRETLLKQAQNAENLYGLRLKYYKQDFEPKRAHPIYGDQTTPFKGPYEIQALIDISSDTTLLSQFGIETTNDIELQITYATWFAVFGKHKPQAGDKFEVKDLLCNKPNGFERAIFEVTSEGDSDIFDLNGKWFISAKRSDFAWLPNEPKEYAGRPVNESDQSGLLDNDTLEPIPDLHDPNQLGLDIDKLADEDFKTEHSQVYGGFYADPDDF